MNDYPYRPAVFARIPKTAADTQNRPDGQRSFYIHYTVYSIVTDLMLTITGLVALAFAYVLSQFYRTFLAVLTPQLIADLGVDKSELSFAAGLWFVSFALMQFVVGIGLDRFGPRLTGALLFGVAGVAGSLFFAMAQSPLAIMIAMVLFGIACAPVLMASLYIFARRYNARQFAIMTSWLVAFGNLGNVVGSSPLASAVDVYGWRTVIATLGGLTALIAIAVLLWVEGPDTSPATSPGLAGYGKLLRMPVLWPIMIMALLCYAPVSNIRGLWAGPYLADLFAADSHLIGQVTLWMALAMVAGSLIYGPLDKLLNTRKWVVFSGNLLVLFALLVFVVTPTPNILIVTSLFTLIGAAGASFGVVMAHGRAFLPPDLIGRGVTLINFCAMFGAGALQFITGQLVEFQSDSSAAHTYQLLFGCYALLLLLALLMYVTARDAPPGRTQLPGDNTRL